MYWDLIVLALIIIVVVVCFRRFSSFVYVIGLLDVFLRALTLVKNHIGLPDVAGLIGKYIPESIPAVIGRYTEGIFYTLLIWAFIILDFIFFGYVFKTFWHKKK